MSGWIGFWIGFWIFCTMEEYTRYRRSRDKVKDKQLDKRLGLEQQLSEARAKIRELEHEFRPKLKT